MRMYHWVAWHRELARKIAEGGRDDLVEKIGQVVDKAPEQALDPAKLGRDPLSFFGFLRNSQSKSNEVCEVVQDVFGLETELPDLGELKGIIFPSLSESLSSEGAIFPVGNDDLLWRLFEQVTQATEDSPDIKQEDWKDAMDIDGVEVGTLTQALFLVNPDCFLPVDSAVDAYFPEGWRDKEGEKIKGNEGYEKYLATRNEIKNRFLGCEPYEIYTFLRWQEDKEIVNEGSNFFQISTNAHGEHEGDFWDKESLEKTWSGDKEKAEEINFKENNWVFVGGAASGIGWKKEEEESLSLDDIKNAIEEKKIKEGKTRGGRPYPLCNDPEKRNKVFPKRGDIVLVRTGRNVGRAIGVVLENDYNKPNGLKRKSKIHVLWINKSQSPIAGGSITGITHADPNSSKTYKYFANEEAYKFSFKLLDQLTEQTIESGKQVNQEDRQQAEANTMKHPHPLNMILYGPPGTGKTYHTSHYAVAIIEGKSVEVIKEATPEKVKNSFDEYRKKKQIGMVTFHQNYAYEDFIEGIRPVLDEDGEGDVKYELRKGVFREISDRADNDRKQVAKNMGQAESKSKSETWDIGKLLPAFATSVQKKLDREEEVKLYSDNDKSRATITKVSREKDGMFRSFQLGGSVTSDQHLYKTVIERDYRDFCDGKIKSAKDIKSTQKSDETQEGHAPYYFLLFKRMREFHDRWIPEPRSVLIIDEINRGNIAKIFGELITLIEDSRRLGNKEETKVTLPYSGESFGVPDNLYIIGTMNTADRSIALLDTALRRRFEFREMMPDPELLPDASTNIDGVNCRDLLEAMNERIRVLLDREHQIGHTYFLDVEDIESLKKVFQNKIIPLLQEYFYDNWEKINLVLNQNGFIVDKSIDSALFKKSDLIDEQRKIYEILSEDDPKWGEPESYKNIYTESNKAQNTEQNQPSNE